MRLFTKPPFVVTALTLFLLLWVLKIGSTINTPFWGLAAPTRFATWRLTTEDFLPGYIDRECSSSASSLWLQVRADTVAAAWFEALWNEAQTTEAQFLALVGLQEKDSALYATSRNSARFDLSDSVTVQTRHGPKRIAVLEVLPKLDNGRLLAVLSTADEWPEC